MASVIEGQILSTREQLAEFARARMFIAARAELIEAGFSASQINSWIDVGRLTTVLHGVYSYGRDVESRDAALKAGLAVAGAGTALTGTTACEKWGADPASPDDSGSDPGGHPDRPGRCSLRHVPGDAELPGEGSPPQLRAG